MNRKRIMYVIFLFIIIFIFINYYGNKFIKRLNTFIIESNNLYINKEVNNYIKKNNLLDTNNLYKFTYDSKNNITGASLNIEKINNVLTKYVDDFSYYLNKTNFASYLDSYYKSYNINNLNYITVPVGTLYDNPLLFNLGPNIILACDDILLVNLFLTFNYKNYGINNIIVNIYLNIEIEQKIIKPILQKNNLYKYSFLISSEILQGNFSGIVSPGFSLQSEGVSTS